MTSDTTSRRLGDIIEPLRIRCGEANPKIVGVDINHQFIPTRANLSEVDTSKYLIVPEGCFASNLMHIGRDERIPLAYNNSNTPQVVTSAYYVFRVRADKEGEILPQYLYMSLCRQEADRYTWYCTDSSIRGNLPELRLFDIKIPLPNIETQHRLVDVWQGLNDIKQDNDAQAEPLMKLCMSYLKKLKSEYPLSPIGKYIIPIDERNTDGKYDETQVKGISIEKQFIDTKAKLEGVGLASYKIVAPKDFAYVTVTSRNGGKISIALNDSREYYLMSSTYEAFRIYSDHLLPEYLYLWFLRSEFDRYARYHSWGSARETFNFDDMCRVRIPVPPRHIQQAIVDIYKCAKECKAIAEQAESLCKKAVPALVQKGAHS